MTECWNDDLGAFTAFAHGDVLDAGALLMPMVKMLAPDDPRFLSTLDAIEDRLVSDSLVLRYDPAAYGDGVSAGDGPDGPGGPVEEREALFGEAQGFPRPSGVAGADGHGEESAARQLAVSAVAVDGEDAFEGQES